MKLPFAINQDGTEFFIKATRSNIPDRVAVCDCMTVIRFPSEKVNYYRVSDVIAWHESEAKVNSDWRSEDHVQFLSDLKLAFEDFKAGKLEVV